MGFAGFLLTLPVLGPPRMVHWIATVLAREVERERLDEGRVRGQLLELQQRYDAGDVGEEEYDRGEMALLDTLKEIRAAKAREGAADGGCESACPEGARRPTA